MKPRPILLRHRYPTIEEIARELRVPMKEVRKIQAAVRRLC